MINIHKVVEYLEDGMYRDLLGKDWLDVENSEVVERIQKEVEEPAKRAICEIFGHRVVMDVCGNPEHDYCTICENRFSGQAIERKVGASHK